MNPEEIEAARIAEEARLAAEPAPPVQNNSAIEELIRNTLAETERARQTAEARNRELEDKINELSRNRNVPINNNNNTAPDPQEFWNNPHQVLEAAISRQIKPLQEAAEKMALQNQYFELKQGYKNQYPAFAQIESLVDQMMIGQVPSHANMQNAIERAVGKLALSGRLNNDTPTNVPTVVDPAVRGTITPPGNVVTPPHLRSSPPVNTIPKDDKPKRRALTENERRVLRETNMTEDKYWELLESSPKVTSWSNKGGK